jgi:DNA mismatch repair protein MutS2
MREFLHSFSRLELDKVKQRIQNYTLSPLGREHVENLAPSADLEEVRHSLAGVSEMKRLLETDDYPPLENVFDIRTSLSRASIENYILSSAELHQIALVLSTSEKIRSYFARRQQLYPVMWRIVNAIQPDKVLGYNIGKAIDDEGNVKDSASKVLSSIRAQIVDKKHSLRRNLESILKSIAEKEWAQEEIITTREGRMVIPVKSEHKNRIPGFIHSSSSSGATVFVEPTVTLELNNEIRTLEFEERREVDKILKELTDQVRASRELLRQDAQGLGELDFIHAKAKYSIEILGVEPRISAGGVVKLIDAYHPVLLQRHKRSEIVPLTLEFGASVRTIIITGPNSGGKTVALKTIGILSLLAQSGCHVPASGDTEMRLFGEVFVEIGDQQSIENDLSSFSSHLSSLGEILKHADDSTLVLIDEICSNTDPSEGASLAAAIIEELTRRGCLSVITTHHGSLKAFAVENSFIENGAMEFDQETLRPSYRFLPGIPGSSYAIEMAKRIELPLPVIARSMELKGNEANKLEQLIMELETKAQELKHNLDSVSREKRELVEMNDSYRLRTKRLESEIKAMKATALEEATQIVEKASSTIERVVRDIRERSAESPAIASAKKDVGELKRELKQLEKELEIEPGNVLEYKVGSHVRLKGSDTVGEILSALDRGMYLVLAGGLKIKVPGDELRPAPAASGAVRRVPGVELQIEAKNEIDLRGMYGDEAISAVEKFISDALVTGLHRVDIIHGKGTGALRKRITAFLKSNSAIKSFRLGEWNEGGAGVTVVELN